MADAGRSAVHGFDTPGSAAAYERGRPSYPGETVAHVVGRGGIGPGRRALDLAAGTGKLTRMLVASGAEVVAVEPMAAMRDQLAVAVPDADVRKGTAEELPLPDASVDAVTVAQAFHWFDASRALAEVRRVLRPGGHLFLLWNMRDREVDWVRAYGDLLMDRDLGRPYDSYYDVDYARVIGDAGGFGPVDHWSQRWEQPFDEDLLVERTSSVSVVAVLDETDRRAVLDRVRHLVRTHPDLAGRSWFGLPYVTAVWHARTVPGAPVAGG